MTDDLAYEFLRAAVLGLGSPFGTNEALSAFREKEGANLEVTLTAEAELRRSPIDSFGAAFSFDEHSELSGDFVGFRNVKSARRTRNAFFGKFERNHCDSPRMGFSATIV
jgi:hypothetical protein